MMGLFLIVVIIAAIMAKYVTSVVHKYWVLQFLNKGSSVHGNKTLAIISTFFASVGQERHSELKDKFELAGYYSSPYSKYFVPAKYILLLICFLATLYFYWGDTQSILIYSMLTIVLVLVVPDSYLALKQRRLIAKNSNQLPYLIDMLSVCVQTGMTVESSFHYLSNELESFDKDLSYQVRKTSDAIKVKGPEAAFRELNKRVPTQEMYAFTTLLIQSIHYGSSMSNMLDDLSADIRRQYILMLEEKIGGLSAKMSVPLIIFIMLPVVVLILAPPISRIMNDGIGL